MKIITLFENRTISDELIAKHGLSLYIETEKKKILFDTGVDDSFIKNAMKLKVDLSEVDILIISHGHYDHGGGLEAFMEINDKADIYISNLAFKDYYSKSQGFFKRYIGLNKELEKSKRLIYVDDLTQIDDNIKIFGDVRGKKLIPLGNKRLYKKSENDKLELDDFKHEINLLVSEKGKNTLFCGCAHNGIVNIISKGIDVSGKDISTVVGGMHLMGIDPNKKQGKLFLDLLSEELNNFNVNKYFTCHCTGEVAYDYLDKKIDNLNDLKTGMVVEV